MYMLLYYNFVVVPSVIVKPQIYIYVCVCVLYCSISARRTFTYLTWKHQLVMSVTYHPHVRQTKFCVLSFPANWWRSVKLQCGTVTATDNAALYIRRA
jgi:hypothetical protein